MASKEIVDAFAADARVDAAVEQRWGAGRCDQRDAAEGVAAFVERRSPNFTWTPAAEQR